MGLGTNLNLLLVERDALYDIETRCLVRLWIGIVCRFEDYFVFGTVGEGMSVSMQVNWSLNSPRGAWGRVPRRGSTYAVRFLFPLGCRSSSALGCIGSDPRIDELSEALGRPELLFGELSCSS